MSDMPSAIDAGGQLMEIGALYAYIKSNNGSSTFTLGTLESVHYDGQLAMAKLAVIKRRYGYTRTVPQPITRKTSIVKCANLIQVYDKYKDI
jgi:hypothetical protein